MPVYNVKMILKCDSTDLLVVALFKITRFTSALESVWSSIQINANNEDSLKAILDERIFQDCSKYFPDDLGSSDFIEVEALQESEWNESGGRHEGESTAIMAIGQNGTPQQWKFLLNGTHYNIHVKASFPVP